MTRLNNSIFQGDPPKLDMSQFWNKPVDYPFQEEEQPSPLANRTQLAIDRGYLPEREEGLSNQEYVDALAENPKEKKPFDFFNFGLGMRRASAGASWLSGIKERNRQNQYLQNQLSTLGQLDALPAEQPNPYNLYAKYGGKLSKFANGGQEDPKKKQQQQPPKKEPIIVTDKNDPRLRAYNDSLNLYNANNLYNQEASNILKTSKTDGEYSTRMGFNSGNIPNPTGILGKAHNEINKILNNHRKWEPISNIDPGYKIWPDGTKRYLLNTLEYKKPVQSVVFQKQPEEKKLTKPSAIPRQKLNFQTGMRPTPDAPPNFQVAQFDNTKPTKYSFSYPTGKYNEQKTVYFPDAGTWKQFIGNQKLINSDEGQGYGTATGYMQEGGEIPNPGFGQMNSTLVEALSNSKKLKFRRSGKFKALIPMEDFNDDVLNYIDKFKNLKRQCERYVKVRGKLAPLDLQAPPEPIEDKFLMLSKGGIKKLRGRK